jgi:hypothetical protein
MIFIAASSGRAFPHQIAIRAGATRLIWRERKCGGAMIRSYGAAMLGLMLATVPAMAQQAPPAAEFPLLLDAPRPADTGKPQILTPPPLVDSRGCAPLDCRLRVIGTVQHNGAVELNATAFRW